MPGQYGSDVASLPRANNPVLGVRVVVVTPNRNPKCGPERCSQRSCGGRYTRTTQFGNSDTGMLPPRREMQSTIKSSCWTSREL